MGNRGCPEIYQFIGWHHKMLCWNHNDLDKRFPINTLTLLPEIRTSFLVKYRKMDSSSREKAAAASAELDNVIDSALEQPAREPTVASSGYDQATDPRQNPDPADSPTNDWLDAVPSAELQSADPLQPTPLDLENLDPNDFDHEFDDDLEPEVPGEYELDDDEYARALLDIVDFEIEGLEKYRDDE